MEASRWLLRGSKALDGWSYLPTKPRSGDFVPPGLGRGFGQEYIERTSKFVAHAADKGLTYRFGEARIAQATAFCNVLRFFRCVADTLQMREPLWSKAIVVQATLRLPAHILLI
jgi:hypothetical protein